LRDAFSNEQTLPPYFLPPPRIRGREILRLHSSFFLPQISKVFPFQSSTAGFLLMRSSAFVLEAVSSYLPFFFLSGKYDFLSSCEPLYFVHDLCYREVRLFFADFLLFQRVFFFLFFFAPFGNAPIIYFGFHSFFTERIHFLSTSFLLISFVFCLCSTDLGGSVRNRGFTRLEADAFPKGFVITSSRFCGISRPRRPIPPLRSFKGTF